MKKIFFVIFTIFLFFFIIQKIYAVETTQINPILELLKIFLNSGTTTNNTSSPAPTFPPINTSLPPSSLDAFFPNTLSPISNNLTTTGKNAVAKCLDKRIVYEQAGSVTGLPWQILAALHYREASCGSGSLVSGRAIGTNEPDIVRAGGCSTGRTGAGIPIVLPGGGCGFATFLDSAIYGGNHLKGKIGRTPENYEDLVKAFGYYNGTGNANCGKVSAYPSCPRYFVNEDHTYALNWFDQRHDRMYIVYCDDGVRCNPPKLDPRPGAMTVLRILAGK